MRQKDLVNSQTTTEAPSSLQRRAEYNEDGTMKYLGFAIYGAASSDDAWTVYEFTYVNGQETLKQTGFGSWDAREDLTYA